MRFSSLSLKSFALTALAALALAGAGAAQADVVSARVNANSPEHAFFDLTAADPAQRGPFYINALDITVAGNPNDVLNGSYFGFCIEPSQVTTREAFFDPNDAGSGTGDSSYTTYFPTITKEVQRLFDMDYNAAMAGGDAGTAFNLVLQELLLEQSGSYSLEDGSYARQGAGDYDLAASDAGSALLAAVLAGPDSTSHFRIVTSVSPDSQDFMMALAPEAPASVPEPGSVALMFSALGAMGLVRRRRRG